MRAILLGFILTIALTSYGQLTLQDSLIAHYKLDGNAADSSGNGYHGSIDDVRIYNRALSGSDVAALYNMWPTSVAYGADNAAQDWSLTNNVVRNAVQIKVNESINGQIQIIDALGKVVKNEPIHADKGSVYQLKISALGAGIYYIRFNGTNTSQVKRIIVQ